MTSILLPKLTKVQGQIRCCGVGRAGTTSLVEISSCRSSKHHQPSNHLNFRLLFSLRSSPRQPTHGAKASHSNTSTAISDHRQRWNSRLPSVLCSCFPNHVSLPSPSPPIKSRACVLASLIHYSLCFPFFLDFHRLSLYSSPPASFSPFFLRFDSFLFLRHVANVQLQR